MVIDPITDAATIGEASTVVATIPNRDCEPIDKVLACYRNGIDSIQRIAAIANDAGWLSQTPCEAWRAIDLAGHLQCTAADSQSLLKYTEKGQPMPLLSSEDLAIHNEKSLAALPATSGPERIAAFIDIASSYADHLPTLWAFPSYCYEDRVWTVGQGAGVLAVEWHVHAWDLAQSLGQVHRPADAESLVHAFRAGMAYLRLPSSYDDPWKAVLSATGRVTE